MSAELAASRARRDIASRQRRTHGRLLALVLVFPALLVIAGAIGAVPLGPRELWGLISGAPDVPEVIRSVFWDIRVPRVVLAALVGGSLALAGAGVQGLFRNPLADPGIIGVSAGAAYSEAFEACVARQQVTGALQAHAYDQPEVLAGAGTLALEIEEQGGRLPDTVLVSVGGGGLIGGVAAWVESRAHVVALEPERAPTLHAARAAGQPVDVEVGGVAADSLGARRIGTMGWEVSQRHVHDALLLPDDAIRAAQLWLWKELKLAAEPAAALGLAALQTGAYKPQPQETVAPILCGANFDPASLT